MIYRGYSFLSTSLNEQGELWVWGRNDQGQLGNGTFEQQEVPVQADTDTDWVDVAMSDNLMLAIKHDGTLYYAGEDHTGQWGDGGVFEDPPDETATLTPINSTNIWRDVKSSLGNHVMALFN